MKMSDCNGCRVFNICDKSLPKPKQYYQRRFVWESIKGVIPKVMRLTTLMK